MWKILKWGEGSIFLHSRAHNSGRKFFWNHQKTKCCVLPSLPLTTELPSQRFFLGLVTWGGGLVGPLGLVSIHNFPTMFCNFPQFSCNFLPALPSCINWKWDVWWVIALSSNVSEGNTQIFPPIILQNFGFLVCFFCFILLGKYFEKKVPHSGPVFFPRDQNFC